MPSFMLLLHQSPSKFQDLSPEDIQKIIARYSAWRAELVRQNKLRGGEKLANDGGRRLRIQGNQVSVTDGPYSEASPTTHTPGSPVLHPTARSMWCERIESCVRSMPTRRPACRRRWTRSPSPLHRISSNSLKSWKTSNSA